ncbi:MAG: hypothetical protein GXO79_10575 [Chlorobi bacterium]|nr:hypothetical protein [Chlorobiota bacterium]
MLFQNIELGINTTPVFNPKLYIDGLLYHKDKLFEYRYKGNFAQVEHERFRYKIYNKSYQYGIREFTLRIELQIKKTEELKSTGIKTFADVNESTLNKAKDLLLSRFDEVVHYDYTINNKDLTSVQKQLLKNYSNQRYWIIDTKPHHRDRHKKRLQQITLKYSKNLQLQLRHDIIKKCVRINQLSEKTKCVIINSSSIGLNITQNHTRKTLQKCIITGIPLTYEKEGAKYIRTSTFKYLQEHNKDKFEEVCSFLLNSTSGGRPKYERSIISHLYKQVRNRYYNQFKIKRVGYHKKKYENQLELTI